MVTTLAEFITSIWRRVVKRKVKNPKGVERPRGLLMGRFHWPKVCYAKTMAGSLDQFVLIKASKSLGSGVWSDDDYIVHDRARDLVVGRIMLQPQAPKDRPWFWTITASEIPPSVHNHGYSATREHAMTDFKARWSASRI